MAARQSVRSKSRRSTDPATVADPEDGTHRLSAWQLAGLCCVIAAMYVVWSLFSDGYYQHDEAGHFLSMRRFWYDPNAVLSNWAKPGYKLITAPISLLGPQALVVANALIASASCYVAYRLAESLEADLPIAAVLLLFAQPLWLQLSFRNYSEPITALILVAAVLAHYKDRDLVAALLLSYTTMIRQEMIPLVGVFALWLLWRRKFGAAALLAVFPLVHNVWGWAATSDPLYLLHEVLGASGRIQDAYPRQGLLHYPKMSLTIFGGLSLTFFLVYLVQGFFRKMPWHWFVLVPAVLFFGMHVVFSIQSFRVGPSTGGNLRYLTVISPLVAVLGAVAAGRLARIRSAAERRPELLTAGVFAIVTLAFLSRAHNNVVLTDQRDLLPFLTVMLAGAVIAWPLTRRRLAAALATVAVVSAALVVRPYERSAEDRAVRAVVEWIENFDVDDGPILMNHTMLYYYLGQIAEEMPEGSGRITEASVREAKPGTVIIWDSHYSYRPSLSDDHLPHTWFLERPERFERVGEPLLTEDRRFGVFVFRKKGG